MKDNSFLHRALAGAAAGGIETIVTMPFEVTKTIQQLQKQQTIPSISSTARKIMQTKGIRGFYYGLPACLVQASGKVAIRFSFYGFYLSNLQLYFGSYINISKGCAGLLAGATESVWIAPCERLKTLRVTQLDLPTSKQSYTSLFGTLKRLNGPLDLYIGTLPTALRNGLAVGGRFLVYDTLKTKISEVSNHQNLWWHSIVCGFSVGVFTTFLSQPADVIKSRMQGSTYNQRTSFIQVTGDIIRKEGFVNGMSRGLSARIWKIGFGQAVIFTVYESVSELLSRTMKV